MVTEIPRRTDEQILARAPIVAKLGEKEYSIKILRITAAQKWREHLIDSVKEITEQMRAETGSDHAFLTGLGYTLLQFPEKMTELIFSYAPDLNKEEIMHETTGATEEQIARVFGQIVAVAFPFRGELQMITQVLGMTSSQR